MANIRPFLNADLPSLLDVWLQHWQAAAQGSGSSPPVSVSVLERAVCSRLFFEPDDLLVAESDGRVVAWCHHQIPSDQTGAAAVPLVTNPATGGSAAAGTSHGGPTAIVPAICLAGEAGVAVCDELWTQSEALMRRRGARRIEVGPLRDRRDGYLGLPPIGHGIGIPVTDTRVASLLSRHGFHIAQNVQRMQVSTPTYRPPIGRDFLMMRRKTRVDETRVIPTDPRIAAAMAHIDMHRFDLIDHRQRQSLAGIDLWVSDPEAQVMEGSLAILSLTCVGDVVAMDGEGDRLPPAVSPWQDGELSLAARYLIATVVQTLSNRRVFTVETAIDEGDATLAGHLETLKFQPVGQGRQWAKEFGEK